MKNEKTVWILTHAEAIVPEKRPRRGIVTMFMIMLGFFTCFLREHVGGDAAVGGRPDFQGFVATTIVGGAHPEPVHTGPGLRGRVETGMEPRPSQPARRFMAPSTPSALDDLVHAGRWFEA